MRRCVTSWVRSAVWWIPTLIVEYAFEFYGSDKLSAPYRQRRPHSPAAHSTRMPRPSSSSYFLVFSPDECRAVRCRFLEGERCVWRCDEATNQQHAEMLQNARGHPRRSPKTSTPCRKLQLRLTCLTLSLFVSPSSGLSIDLSEIGRLLQAVICHASTTIATASALGLRWSRTRDLLMLHWSPNSIVPYTAGVLHSPGLPSQLRVKPLIRFVRVLNGRKSGSAETRDAFWMMACETRPTGLA